MDRGDVFLMGVLGARKKHWWIVLNDPQKYDGNCVIVNITTDAKRTDGKCVLKIGDHQWITEESHVCFGDAILIGPEQAKIIQGQLGKIIIPQPPAKTELVQRIIAAAKTSKSFPIIFKKYLD